MTYKSYRSNNANPTGGGIYFYKNILCIMFLTKRYRRRTNVRALQWLCWIRAGDFVVDDKSDDCRDSFRYPETVPYACRTKYLA